MTALAPEKVPFWPWGLLLFVAGAYILGVAALIAAGRREDARALAGFIPDCLVLVSRLARDTRISRPRRAASSLSWATWPSQSTWSPISSPASVSSTMRCCSDSR